VVAEHVLELWLQTVQGQPVHGLQYDGHPLVAVGRRVAGSVLRHRRVLPPPAGILLRDEERIQRTAAPLRVGGRHVLSPPGHRHELLSAPDRHPVDSFGPLPRNFQRRDVDGATVQFQLLAAPQQHRAVRAADGGHLLGVGFEPGGSGPGVA